MWKNFSLELSWLCLYTFCGISITVIGGCLSGCTPIGTSITEGSLNAVFRDSTRLRTVTRQLTQEIATTATQEVRNNLLLPLQKSVETSVNSIADTVAGKTVSIVHHSANRLDSSIIRFYAGADRTIERSLTLTRRELTNPELLRFLAHARDTVLGEPTKHHVEALVQVAFQEFRRQQDSTLQALEGRSESWQTHLQHLATPILAVLGGIALVGVCIIGILKLIFLIQSRKHHG